VHQQKQMIAPPRKKGKEKLAPDQKLENEGVKKKKNKKSCIQQ